MYHHRFDNSPYDDDTHMRTAQLALLIATTLAPSTILGQSLPSPKGEAGVYLTIFRSPATGVELRAKHVAAHAGFYPTILSKNGARGNVNFIRVGGTYYVRPQGTTLFVTPSMVVSLDSEWKHGALTEVGLRGRLFRGMNGRIGIAMLTTTDGLVRVNPTIGMDIKLGGGR